MKSMIYEQQNIFIIDNFYSNPDTVRDYALSLPYRKDVMGYHFWRTTPRLNYNIIPLLEKYIGNKISLDHFWTKHPVDEYIEMNMSFYKVINNPNEDYARATHIHHDLTHWSGIVYLSPDLPPNVGTQFWRHKPSGDNFAYGNTGFTIPAGLDARGDTEPRENWEKTDYMAYKYNRLVLFRGTMFHSAAHTKEMPDGDRLNQFFYFNQVT
jgi:hypothetical protein